MKKAEALAKQAATIEEVVSADRGSDIAQIAEHFTLAEVISDTQDYEPDEIRKYIPFGSYLRELEVIHQTESAAAAAVAASKPVEEYPADGA